MRSRDEFYSVRKLLKFAWMLFSESNDIHLSFGKAMDVVGNPVDANGISYDQHGRPVDVKDYFTTDGQVTANHQRESEYTKWVSNRIVERFYKDNIVLSSHLVAFAAFNLLQKQFSDLDVYGLLRFPVDEYQFSRQALEEILAQLKAVLFEMEQSGQIHLSDQIYKDPSAILEDGIRRMGSYHAEKPLRMNKKGEIVSESFHILYFYHNRLDNYGLEQKINWRLIHLPEPELAEP